MGIRIIGIGTIDRGDDAAGLLVARRLRELHIEAAEHDRDGLSLLDAFSGHDHVILIDAVVTGAPPGSIRYWDAAEAPVVPDPVRGSTHAFGVAEAIQLARALGRMPARIEIYGIEGAQFGVGAAPTLEVAAAVEELAKEIATRPGPPLANGSA